MDCRSHHRDFERREDLKLLIIGHGRHGKDTVAEILRDKYGLQFESSSSFASKHFIYKALKEIMSYKSEDECFKDRHSMRSLWYELICSYNREDKCRLTKDILSKNDIYVGMRDLGELVKCKEDKIFDLIIWVDASERVDYSEPTSSMTITKDFADIVVNNNGSLDELTLEISKIVKENKIV